MKRKCVRSRNGSVPKGPKPTRGYEGKRVKYLHDPACDADAERKAASIQNSVDMLWKESKLCFLNPHISEGDHTFAVFSCLRLPLVVVRLLSLQRHSTVQGSWWTQWQAAVNGLGMDGMSGMAGKRLEATVQVFIQRKGISDFLWTIELVEQQKQGSRDAIRSILSLL